MPARKYPKPLSTTQGRQVQLNDVPNVGDTFITTYGKAKQPLFLVVTDVAEHIRAKDQSKTHIIAFQDEYKNYYSAGLSAKSLAKHGRRKPDINKQKRNFKFTPEEIQFAKPTSPSGIGVKLQNVPNIGDLFWTFPNNDNTKPKIYVKVTDVRPYKSPADGTQKYLVMYRDKDNNIYSSQLESYKLVNISEPDPIEKAAEKFKNKITKAEQNA